MTNLARFARSPADHSVARQSFTTTDGVSGSNSQNGCVAQPRALYECGERMQQTNIRQRIAEATAEELTTARDDYMHLSRALRGMATIASRPLK